MRKNQKIFDGLQHDQEAEGYSLADPALVLLRGPVEVVRAYCGELVGGERHLQSVVGEEVCVGD